MDRLVFVTLSLTKGGAERVICNMCNEHFVKRYQVTIISLMAARPEYELDSAIRVICLDTEEAQYKQNLAARFLRRRAALAKTLKQMKKAGEAPDLIISFLPEPNFLINSLSAGCGCPVIISVRNDPAKEYGSKVRYCLMRMLYKRADGYVFQTKQAKDYFHFSRHITENSVVIPNPLGREFLNVTQSAQKNKEVVAVGRLEEQKDPLMLIRAFTKVHHEFPEYVLSFYGEGSLRDRMLALIRENGMEDFIVIKGNTDQIQNVVRDAALFVLPSKYEGMPNALMEAMAMGLPCIATNCPCGGPEFLIHSGENGILISVGNEAELSDAMRYFLEDEERAMQMGRKAQRITKELAPDMIYEKWEQFISEKRGR